MNLDVVVLLESGITKVFLSGRFGIDGAFNIAGEFNKIAEENRNVLVDLSEVTFIASAGVHALITGAIATIKNGGKLVLLNPQPNVEKVLRSCGVDTIMPITHGMAAVAGIFGGNLEYRGTAGSDKACVCAALDHSDLAPRRESSSMTAIAALAMGSSGCAAQ
jgi:anti-anti-sigma factor